MRAAGQMTIFDLMAARDPVAEAAAAVDAEGLDPSRAAVFARRIFRGFGAEEARRRVSLLGLVFGGGGRLPGRHRRAAGLLRPGRDVRRDRGPLRGDCRALREGRRGG